MSKLIFSRTIAIPRGEDNPYALAADEVCTFFVHNQQYDPSKPYHISIDVKEIADIELLVVTVKDPRAINWFYCAWQSAWVAFIIWYFLFR